MIRIIADEAVQSALEGITESREKSCVRCVPFFRPA